VGRILIKENDSAGSTGKKRLVVLMGEVVE
jgi:hypothetical protein